MTKMKTKKMVTTIPPMMTTASTRNWLAKNFAELRAQYIVTRDTIKAKGRSHAAAQEEILKLSEVFKQFRLVPKQFDYLVNSMRVMMDRVRTQERLIMKLCVEQCKMPRKTSLPCLPATKPAIPGSTRQLR